ncbi:MAG TPA: lysine-sensitive aspartokinase 3 [Bryobacteraceae bacterium]|jgi:aspartate kinase|nr:lysine-sensitive aspartokinase 3 [Bryobacteraceae bacterium]
MIVMKFGGTSVESAAAIQRVAEIVKARLAQKPVVVVSAMGKTTNRLLEIAKAATSGKRDQALGFLYALRDFHLSESGMERTVEEHFQELADLVKGLAILGELTPRSIDAVASFGERLSSLIVTRYFQQAGLPAVHLDSRKVIVTDRRFSHATPLYPETYARLSATVPALAENSVVVMGGFIAATEDGVTTTLGRGGSDFTASIAGAGIDADEIQIWTDVDGLLTCDPTVVPGGHRIKHISFAEAAELAYFGARVLHPATVLPAIERNIPVLILNSRRPEVPGTRITAEAIPTANIVKSIACKKHVVLLNIHSTRMFMAHGFLRRIFDIFDRYETPVDMISTSEVSVSLTIDDPVKNLERIVEELQEFSEVTVDHDQSIVCLVGENMRNTNGLGARIFGALAKVNVRMVSQGASSLNLGLLVAAGDLREAVTSLHQEFFRDLDPEIFARDANG